MSTEHEKTFTSKLQKLTNTQQSIQALSVWVLFYIQKYKETVAAWKREIVKARGNKILTYLYLANDVIQNSRKKTENFVKEFGTAMSEILPRIWREMPTKDQQAFLRVVNVWDERKVFPSVFIADMKRICTTMSSTTEKKSHHNDHHAATSSAAVDANAYPLSKAYLELKQVEQENSSKDMSKITADIELAKDKIKDEKSLAPMSYQELHDLQEEYDGYIKRCTALRMAYTKESEQRNKVLQLLQSEEKKMKGQQAEVEKLIQTWLNNTITIQNILTKIEIGINSKKLDDDFGNKKRGIGEITNTNDYLQNFGDDEYQPMMDDMHEPEAKRRKLAPATSITTSSDNHHHHHQHLDFNDAVPQPSDVSSILSALSAQEEVSQHFVGLGHHHHGADSNFFMNDEQ